MAYGEDNLYNIKEQSYSYVIKLSEMKLKMKISEEKRIIESLERLSRNLENL